MKKSDKQIINIKSRKSKTSTIKKEVRIKTKKILVGYSDHEPDAPCEIEVPIDG